MTTATELFALSELNPSLSGRDCFNIDKTSPTVQSITRLTPTGQSTNLTTVTIRVTNAVPVMVNTPETSRLRGMPVNGCTIVGAVTGVTGTGATRDVTVNLTSAVSEFKLRVID